MVFYYHLLKLVEAKTMDLNMIDYGAAQNALNLMRNNFQSLKDINHSNLGLYK